MKVSMRTVWAILVLAVPATATEPSEAKAVATVLRDAMVKKIPNPAVDSKSNWGRQKDIIVGYDPKRRGPLQWDWNPRTEKKNDGQWTNLIVTLPTADKSLSFDMTRLQSPEPGRVTFTATLTSSDVHLILKHQSWKAGVRLLSNETHATCHASVTLDCTVSQRMETKPGATLPEMVLKLNVNKVDLDYDRLKVSHTLGLGGDAAKIIGDLTHKMLKEFKPSLEKELVAKANAAIVKAANEKEVRVSLNSLFKK